MTERLHFHFSLSCTGEGNGSPLQCSCLESPRDGGAWWAAVYGVAQSRTRMKRLSSSSRSSSISKSCLALCDPMDCSTPASLSSPAPGACSNSCPLSRWCHPVLSSSVVPFSSCLQSFPALRSFPRSQFFTSGGQSIRVSALASCTQPTLNSTGNWIG